MKDTSIALQTQSFPFTDFSRGYYFSVGYFAFTNKTEYDKCFVRNLHDGL